MSLIELIDQNKYDYCSIYCNPKTIKRLSSNERDCNFVIGVKGRTEFFRATLPNIMKAVENANNIRVRVIIVEQDETPINNEFCQGFDVDYIFILQELAQCENFHSTALMYNIGYLFSKQATYNFYHCCDILLPRNFFNILNEHYLNKEFNWLQPFSNKRVITISQQVTDEYLSGRLNDLDPDNIDKAYVIEENSGAPGGCICIPSDMMDKVGGYCPEIQWAYSLEDAEIWARLECVSSGKQANGIHLDNALYADNPRIDIYHFMHPRAQNLNPYFERMLNDYNKFISLTYEEQIEFINIKREKFLEQKNKLIEIRNHGEL